MPPKVQIKGIREGLLVSMGEGEWPELRAALLELMTQQQDFLRGGKLYLDVGNQVLHAAELGSLRDEISERSLSLWGVLSNSPTTEQTAQSLGLATRLSRPSANTYFRSQAAADTEVQGGESAMVIRRTLRSGYSLKFPGSVIVIGDVNPGAEIIAGGSVVVWGHLRGVVHAGAEGDGEAVVCALDLSPTQLRIGEQIALSPQRRGKALPEQACLKDGKVISEEWKVR